MLRINEARSLAVCASPAESPYRYCGHILILSLASLVALFGGWQRSVNMEALAEAAHVYYAEESYVYQAPNLALAPAAPQESSASLAPSKVRIRPRLFITAQDAYHEEEVRTAPAVQPSPAESERRPEPFVHVVAKGETLQYLSERYGISLDTLRWANAIENPDRLAEGQQLLILPVSGVLHTVREGDTLFGLAARYQVEPGAIVEFNRLKDPDRLAVGEKLIVPGGRMPDPPRAQPSARGAAPPSPPRQPVQQQAPQAAPAQVPPRSALEVDIVNTALEYLGYPYVWGGASPRGFDCSGFVVYVFRQKGIYLPRDLWGMLQVGVPVSRDALRPGDLVFFQNTYRPGLSHVGIYMGNGQFVNAKDEASGVTVSSMYSEYWSSRYYGARRILQ